MTIGRIPSVEGGIQPTIFDAKADILTATAADTPARLAVGNNGEQLLADSSATTGLRWQGSYEAGKNKIINGDFAINQRAFSSTTSDATYGFDRWFLGKAGDGTVTYSAQTFTPGTAPVSGYEGVNFARVVTTGQTTTSSYAILIQRVEDVKTLAGQTVTVSFWAKAASGTPSITVELQQNYGAGGTATSDLYKSKIAITTSWVRYSVTLTLGSLSGKTIGTGSNLGLALWVSAGSNFNSRLDTLGLQANTFDIWGVQVESGSVATAFQTATGTLQGELAACQRYYYRVYPGAANARFSVGMNNNTTTSTQNLQLPVSMRVSPTAVDFSGLEILEAGNAFYTITGLTLGNSNVNVANLSATVASGLTQFRPSFITGTATTSYIGLTAEL